MAGGSQAEVHILVQDPTPACEALGGADVNLMAVYLAASTRLVLAPDNFAAAKSALS